MSLIDPQELELAGKTYLIGKFTATAGREIIAKYPISNVPKLGSYDVSEEVMLKLMKHVAVVIDGKPEPLVLSTRALVDNHVPDWETLAKIEYRTLERNVSFFRDGRASTFFAGIGQLIQQLTTQTLTDLLPQLLKAAEQRSTNSEQSTA